MLHHSYYIVPVAAMNRDAVSEVTDLQLTLRNLAVHRIDFDRIDVAVQPPYALHSCLSPERDAGVGSASGQGATSQATSFGPGTIRARSAALGAKIPW